MQEEQPLFLSIEIQLYAALMLKYMSEAVEERLRAHDKEISTMQYDVLRMLQAEPLTISVISQRMRIDPSTLVRVVDGLERKNLAVRGRDARDRRRNPISITTEGQELLSAVPVLTPADLPFQALQALGTEEVVHLRDLLRSVIRYFPEGRQVSDMLLAYTQMQSDDQQRMLGQVD